MVDFQLGKKKYQKNPPVLHFNKETAKYDLFTTGETFFSSLFTDIKNATSQVDMMFFIVRNDEISLELYDLLKQKAIQGVKVRLLVDQVGSFKLKKSIINDLKDSGVAFSFSNKIRFPFLFYKLNRRNHRKITVIDQKIGYVGGFNVGKEYLGKDPNLGPWRDYHLRTTGNIVDNLKQVFKFDWNMAVSGNQFPKGEIIKQSGENSTAQQTIKLYVTESGQLEHLWLNWITNAKSEILIGTPYFIPSTRIFEALEDALSRGVDVKIIVPIQRDHPFVKSGSIPFYQKLSRLGAEVYLYDNGFYHAKILMIDEKLCDVGTANFDRRSIFLNKEVNCLFDTDTDFITQIRTAFFEDMKTSHPFSDQWVKQQPLKIKLSGIIARIIRPLL